MRTRTTFSKWTGTERVSFGVKDGKGREVGALAQLSFQTYEEVAPGPGSYYTDREPGTWFAWVPVATRGGEGFGASQAMRHCKTETERKAAIQAYFADARKRAIKKFGTKA